MLEVFKSAYRALLQNPDFTATAIISIVLATGANSAIFNFPEGLFSRPVPRIPQFVMVSSRTSGGTPGKISYPDFVDIRNGSRSFDAMMAYEAAPFGFARDSRSTPQLRTGFLVTANFFQLLGVKPRLGRTFQPQDDQVPGLEAVIVLSNDFWKTEFGADPSVIGRRVRLNTVEYTVIGVAPASFPGLNSGVRPAFFVPVTMGAYDLLIDRSNRAFQVKARLRPGVSIPSADEEVAGLARRMQAAYPADQDFNAVVQREAQAHGDDPVTPALLGLFLFALIMSRALAAQPVAWTKPRTA